MRFDFLTALKWFLILFQCFLAGLLAYVTAAYFTDLNDIFLIVIFLVGFSAGYLIVK